MSWLLHVLGWKAVSKMVEALKDKVLGRAADLWAARQAMRLEDERRVLASENAVADAHHKRYLGGDYRPPADDMGDIRIGDTTINYPTPAAPAAAAPAAAPAAGQAAAAAGMGALGKLAASAALLATGAGGAVVVPKILDALTAPPSSEAPAEPAGDRDADTLFDLRIVPDEEMLQRFRENDHS